MITDNLHRLIAIDAALASREGAHIGTLAAQLGVSEKSVQRDIAILRALSPIRCEIVPADNPLGRSHRHWYRDRRRRVFAPWLRPSP